MDIPKDESLIKYPCQFPIKVMGVDTASYRLKVVELVSVYVPELCDEHIKERHSKSKKYLSLTITINAQNREQLDAVYSALTSCDEVSWVL